MRVARDVDVARSASPTERRSHASDPGWRPLAGFLAGASAAVQHLHLQHGLDLWLVTRVEGEEQTVVAAAGPWQALAAPGAVFAWSASLCRPMAAGRGPLVAASVQDVPAYSPLLVGPLAGVRAYLGVPLVADDGTLLGTLCAFAGSEQHRSLQRVLEPVELVGRMLSTLLAAEQQAERQSAGLALAQNYAERDSLTGLRNRRGWQSAVAQEDDRTRRYGGPLSVLVVDLDDLKQVNDSAGHDAGDRLLAECAGVLSSESRPGDAVARVGGDEFAILAVQCDAAAVRALALRLRVQLRSAGVGASVGAATRRVGEDIAGVWQRADQEMYREKRRHARRGAAAKISRPTAVPRPRISSSAVATPRGHVPQPVRRAGIVLPAEPHSVPTGRHFLLRTLREWGLGELSEVVGLAGSELVTNAVLHARTACEVTVTTGAELVVSVRDTGASWMPDALVDLSDGDAEGGHGLALVAAVARTWGVQAHGTGKTVWFSLALP